MVVIRGFPKNALPLFGLLVFHEKDLSKATTAKHAHLQLRFVSKLIKASKGVQGLKSGENDTSLSDL